MGGGRYPGGMGGGRHHGGVGGRSDDEDMYYEPGIDGGGYSSEGGSEDSY